MARGMRKKAEVIDEVMPAEIKEEIKVEVAKPEFKVGIVTAQLNIRGEASLNSPILGCLTANTQIKIAEEVNGFGKLYDQPGWVMLKFVNL